MKILLVTATTYEAALLRAHWGLPDAECARILWKTIGELELGLVFTGVGMVNTALRLGGLLESVRPDLLINFGIAGAFPGGPSLLETVEVVQDCFAELGAESPDGFLTLEQMGFANFEQGGITYYNVLSQPRSAIPGIKSCRGITVNTVSGEQKGIAQRQKIWSPEVETMEVAAFFQACICSGIPFRAFRAISNRVEPRNRSSWKLKEAVETMQLFMISLFEGEEKRYLEL